MKTDINRKIILIGTIASSLYTFRSDLIKMLVKNGWQVYAFTCQYQDNDLEKIKMLGAIPVTYKMNRGGLNPLADLSSMWELKKQIQGISPLVVFSYFVKPVIYGTLAAKIAKVPKILGMLEGLGYAFTEQPEGQSFKTKTIRRIQVVLYKIVLPMLNHLIFLNPDDIADLLNQHKIPVKNVHMLGGIGLNLRDFPYSPAPTQPINFLFIGRLLKEKGIFEFISAAKIVKLQYPNTQFTILGSIDKHNQGALSSKELDLLVAQDLIQYPGQVDNIQSWIQNSSIFVLPSYREGVPRSTQEAMATGRPVITTNVPGCRETVINGENGFLIPKWDSQALAEKMIYFIEHPEQVNIMGRESNKIAIEKFDADKTNLKLLQIINS